MQGYPRFVLLGLVLLSGILYWGSRTPAAAPPISGTYKITQNADLGSQVRITCEFDLVNPTSTPVTITRLGLPSISAPGQMVAASSNLLISSHSSAQVSLQFLISRRDFEAWHMAPHQIFLVTLVPSGGSATLFSLPLLRTQG